VELGETMTHPAPKRIQRKRTKGWRMPPNTVYVGRPSKWGNPYDWREYRRDFDERLSLSGLDREEWCRQEAIDSFVIDIKRNDGFSQRMLKFDPADIKKELRGKNLACWCNASELCHADILMEIANE
jgi:hypothetical protein